MKTKKIFFSGIIVLFLLFSFSNGFASPFRKNTASIMFGGVIGAGAGLGSLIFYSNPQSHTDNITTGLILGLLGGAVYVVSQKDQLNMETMSPVTKDLISANGSEYIQNDILLFNQNERSFKTKEFIYPIASYRLEF